MTTYSEQVLKAIIADYKSYRKAFPDTQLSHCKSQDGFSSLLNAAAKSVDQNGKIHRHQYRQGYGKMKRWAEHLANYSGYLQESSDFDTLYARLFELRHSRISHLTVYDIALRIGSHRTVNKLPKKVYLHSGAAKGAQQLLPDNARNQPFLNVRDLPTEFHKLSPADIEDILCIYEGKWLTGPDKTTGCKANGKSNRIC